MIRENLAPLARVLAEIVLAPALREQDFEQARRLLLAEHVQRRDDDQDLAGRAFRRALFAGGPLGRPPSGTVASLGRIAVDECRAFHRALCVLVPIVEDPGSNLRLAAAEFVTRLGRTLGAGEDPPPR